MSCAALTMAALAVAPNAFAADAITAHYRTSASGATTDQVEPWFKLVNSGTTSVPLSDVKIRYYFRAETPDVGYRFACSWAVRGCANVTSQFGTLTGGSADRYLGMLSSTLQQWEEAVAHFERAMVLEADIGGVALLPRTKYWYARMYRARGHTTDERRADRDQEEGHPLA